MKITYETIVTVEVADDTGEITGYTIAEPYDSQGMYHDCPVVLVDGDEPGEIEARDIWRKYAPLVGKQCSYAMCFERR